MATAIVGGLGSYMARTAFLGSIDAVVQDPAQRRDTMLYGGQIIFDGNPWRVNEGVAVDGTDIVLTTTWQQVPGCAITLTKTVKAGDLRVITATQLWETGAATAKVELGVSKEIGTPPTGPSWEFSAIVAGSNESYPATCICESAGAIGETIYLWIRVTGGQVTLRGTYTPSTPEGAKQRTTKMGIIVPLLDSLDPGAGYLTAVSDDPAPTLGGDLATNGNDIVVTEASGNVYGRIKPLLVDGFVTWAGVDLEPDVAHGYSSFTINGVDASQPSIGFSIDGAEAGWVGTAGIPGENGVMLHGNGLTTVRSGTGDVEIYASNGEVRLGESSLTGDLATNGNHIAISRADGTVLGAVTDTTAGGVIIAYDTDGIPDAADSAVELLPGAIEVRGTTVDIRSLDDGSGEAVAVRSIGGRLFTAPLPPPSWSLSDTSTDVVDPQPSPGTWFEVPGLFVTTTAGEPIEGTDTIEIQIQLYWTNFNIKIALVEAGLGIDAAEPTIGYALPALGKNFSGLITQQISLTPGALPADTVLKVWVRETGTEGNPVLDGSTGTAHTLLVSRESTGGGTGSAPVTERLITQSGVLDIVVADNEHVIVTADGVNSITFGVAAPPPGSRTVGLLEIIGPDRGITSPNIPAGDWPNATVPDLSTGRHLVGCNRGSTGYAMTEVPYQ